MTLLTLLSSSSLTVPLSYTDTAGATDQIIKSLTSVQTDQAGSTDVVTFVWSRQFEFTDSVDATDTVPKTIAPALITDLSQASDQFTFVGAPNYVDTANVTDQIIKSLTSVQIDPAGATDAVTFVWNRQFIFSDTVDATDAVPKTFAPALITDSSDASDEATLAWYRAMAFFDTSTVEDTVAFNRQTSFSDDSGMSEVLWTELTVG